MKPAVTLGDDIAQPFQLETSLLRGRLVRLGPALDLILHQHAYPKAVGTLLGESVVIATALGTSLKYEGVFTFQVKSEGLVKLLVADVTSEGGLRAYAQHQVVEQSSPQAPLLGKGFLAFTIDQKLKDDRYQGIVALEGDSLAEAVQHYFRQSEQLPTGLVAAVRQDELGRWRGGCLMVQQMPREGGHAHDIDTSVADDWHRTMMLMGTCQPTELTDSSLGADELLYRLFHEEGVRVFDAQTFHHQCRCSKTRVESMLRSLPQAEVETLAVDGIVDVSCEFCNTHYRYTPEQLNQLYRTHETD